MKIDFCVPIYNEELILEESISSLYSFLLSKNLPYDWRIVIVDNGSKDQSREIANKLANEKISLFVVNRPGRGRAIRKYWSNSDADIVSYMDADLAVNLKHVPELVGPIIQGEAEIVIGSRLLPESVIERNIFRETISRSCNVLYRLFFGYGVNDTQCGFKAVKKSSFNDISQYFFDDKWFFDTELITYMKYKKNRLKEIPVEWNEKRFDKRNSKVKVFKDSFNHFMNFLKLKKKIREIGEAS
ncbi:hypothetical protein C0584_06170 [Candidatus Parcubacteria bacterium]|nr:MAG: hypothetical protein C0584_06170 [Candidatus Parcubacteria bacterium]